MLSRGLGVNGMYVLLWVYISAYDSQLFCRWSSKDLQSRHGGFLGSDDGSGKKSLWGIQRMDG